MADENQAIESLDVLKKSRNPCRRSWRSINRTTSNIKTTNLMRKDSIENDNDLKNEDYLKYEDKIKGEFNC